MNLSQLNDVAVSNLQNNQIVQYDSSLSKWKNSTIQTLSQLSALTDVSVSSVQNNQAIIYDSTAQKYENKQINHVNLSNKGTKTHTEIDTHLTSSSGVHGVTGSVVGTSDNQSLTTKTIDDSTNSVTAKALYTASSKVNIDETVPTLNQALIISHASSTPYVASWKTIDHTNLTNIGTNTHSQIDSFISCFVGNTIVYYVDSKYTGVIKNGSQNFPYAMISEALSNITVPTDNNDPNLSSRFIIHVAGGQYDENLTINIGGGRHIT